MAKLLHEGPRKTLHQSSVIREANYFGEGKEITIGLGQEQDAMGLCSRSRRDQALAGPARLLDNQETAASLSAPVRENLGVGAAGQLQAVAWVWSYFFFLLLSTCVRTLAAAERAALLKRRS